MNLTGLVENKFKELYDRQPLVVRSPGRVNLIGEHTDYNEGYVLPAAIDKAIYLAIAPRNDRTCTLFAFDKNESHQFSVDAFSPSRKGWPNYLVGVVDQLRKAGHDLGGFDCVFAGDIPIGAGLSSSAALEMGFAFALNHLFDLKIDKLALVKLAQKSENEFVGVHCGIMDQFINIFGRENNLLRIDCRSLEFKYFAFDFDVSIILLDTHISRSLASSEYNRRREECNEGVNAVRNRFPQVTHLRDVSLEMLNECRQDTTGLIYKRCKYVIEENQRVLNACRALENRDLPSFGQYLFESHRGLSHEYEVSCKELDFLVDLARAIPDVVGSRMMGGGFGGCTINLVHPRAVDEVRAFVTRKYNQRFRSGPSCYITTVGAGTTSVKLDENATARIP